ncbi:APC family permease [Cryptosporangium phraense]|uniref:APC family permease n=1 Tax=Cryptosporangium phraense TaxID=2593070 RepID=UPI0014787614|nr:APC family permease [Cryptosporangium phraense]
MAIVAVTLGAAAPLTTVAGAVPSAFAVTGLVPLSAAFIVVGAVLALFATGYVRMARLIRNPGAFYAYVRHGLGVPMGLATALIAVLGYGAFVSAAFGGLGAAAEGFVAAEWGSSPPWWAWSLAGWILVTVLGVLRVDLSGWVLMALLAAETAVVLLFLVVNVSHPASSGSLPVAVSWSPRALLVGGAAVLMVLAVTAFTGFEATAVFTEEARNPASTVPRATWLTLGLMTAVYALSAWAITVAAGPRGVVTYAQHHAGDTVFALAAQAVPSMIVTVARGLFVTSVFAALLSFHMFVSRYLFALGREGVLPPALGRAGLRSGVPRNASLTVSAVGLIVVAIYAVGGWDPLLSLFYCGGALGGFAVLLLITITACAVVVFLARRPEIRPRRGAMIASAISAVTLGAVVVLAVLHFDVLLGVAPTDPLRWVLPGAYGVVAMVGIAWAAYLRKTRPEIYAQLGFGVHAPPRNVARVTAAGHPQSASARASAGEAR